ncbi:MAG TPA: hypothetical protein VKG91_05785 [Roseiarcus sp.]|nr:hypothetical protein [Roseiarcus sp.]
MIAQITRFGAKIYAIGGDRTSAALMGLPKRPDDSGIAQIAGLNLSSLDSCRAQPSH